MIEQVPDFVHMDIRPLAGLAARCVLATARRPHVGERHEEGRDPDHDHDRERPPADRPRARDPAPSSAGRPPPPPGRTRRRGQDCGRAATASHGDRAGGDARPLRAPLEERIGDRPAQPDHDDEPAAEQRPRDQRASSSGGPRRAGASPLPAQRRDDERPAQAGRHHRSVGVAVGTPSTRAWSMALRSSTRSRIGVAGGVPAGTRSGTPRRSRRLAGHDDEARRPAPRRRRRSAPAPRTPGTGRPRRSVSNGTQASPSRRSSELRRNTSGRPLSSSHGSSASSRPPTPT